MPVIKSAKKKLKQDKKREKTNKILRDGYRNAVKEAKKRKTNEKIRQAVRLVDKAVTKRLIHKNKAARIKSNLSKLIKTIPTKIKQKAKTTKKKKVIKNKK